jgi:hypothetical protein
MISKNRIVSLFLSVTLLLVSSGIVLAACGANQAQTTGSISTPTATSSAANGSTATPAQPAATSAITTPNATQSATNNSTSTSASSQSATPTLKSPDTVQNCGKIEISPLHRLEDAGLAQTAGACFWQDYQQCRSATLAFHPLGVDTVTIHTFQVEKTAGGCMITDSVSQAVVPHAPKVTNYTCTGIVNANGALRFTSCGAEGDVIVPLV